MKTGEKVRFHRVAAAAIASASLVLGAGVALAQPTFPVPLPYSPSDTSGPIATTLPTYRWFSPGTGTQYHLYVNDSAGTRINAIYSATDTQCPTGGFCSITPTTAVFPGKCKFWVRAVYPTGLSSWGGPVEFTVTPP
jgi:hypothetical protein